eukprot:TRINITY_DN3969_c0_g2_i3.p1 TRINITY_DN3969_c0_g2~~TRINITY_DN3969_c0_g2_i3.p1  ORF type:complete len:102 (-),score=8.75 TRINITY_DN3969_c0_g2_i3:35-340(-)
MQSKAHNWSITVFSIDLTVYLYYLVRSSLDFQVIIAVFAISAVLAIRADLKGHRGCAFYTYLVLRTVFWLVFLLGFYFWITWDNLPPVSYTHLTLPTIYSV